MEQATALGKVIVRFKGKNYRAYATNDFKTSESGTSSDGKFGDVNGE